MQNLNKTCTPEASVTYQSLTDFRPTVQGTRGPERICPFELAHCVNNKTIEYGVICTAEDGLTLEDLARDAQHAVDGQPCLCLVTPTARTRQFIYSQHVPIAGVFPVIFNARLVNFEALPLDQRRRAICLTYGQHTNANDDYRPDPTWPSAREIRGALRSYVASLPCPPDRAPAHFIPAVFPDPGKYVDWAEALHPLSETRAGLPAASPCLAIDSVSLAG